MSGHRLGFGYSIISCMALFAFAVVASVERGFAWLFTVLPISPPRLALAAERITNGGISATADPQVERHEAGLARLGAVRHC